MRTAEIDLRTFASEHLDEAVAWTEAPPIAALAALDRSACGMDRTALIARLAAEGRIALQHRDGVLRGFAALRPFGRGEVIGPVVAENPVEARALLSFVMATRPGAFLRVDTPEETGLGPWLAPVGRGVAMQRGGEPPRRQVAGPRTFALAAQALG
ncbi:hypothetical protein [Methylobacterium sp. ID0610]|uniref:hypothetical protein n=1 Tax=Methylobacterium carpenticola TaxID=3344827 RepID=UPI0036757D37